MSSNNFRGKGKQRVDLSPLDFYLWEHLKSLLYSDPNENEETVHQSIFDAFQTIRNRLGGFLNGASVYKTVHSCVYSSGGHSEHLL